jgi:succinate dehydrogenase/fumarate reductase cytochrome b subunit
MDEPAAADDTHVGDDVDDAAVALVDDGDDDGDDDDADGDDADDESEPLTPAVPPSRRWAHTAAIVSLLYACWYVIGLVVLEISPTAYNSMNRAYGSLAFRLVLAAVALALIFHLADGTRVAITGLFPRTRAHDLGLRASARFVTLAAGIPAIVVILWPAIRSWFSR